LTERWSWFIFCSRMSVALAPCPEIALPAEPAEGASRRERQIAVLGEIAEIGLSIAREIETQLIAREMPPEKAAIAYGRVARAVRLTIALQARLVAEARDPAPGALDEQRQARRAQVNRIVRRVVGENTRDVEICVYRWGQARERLEHDDIYGDLLSRPASEIVAAVCQDLGVAPNWARRSPSPIGRPGDPPSMTMTMKRPTTTTSPKMTSPTTTRSTPPRLERRRLSLFLSGPDATQEGCALASCWA
jgi:hypothetical protein